MDEQFGPETGRVRRFLARLEQLSVAELAHVMSAWRAAVLSERWFEADRGLGAAIQSTGRFAIRLGLLDAVHEIFRRAPWFKPDAPDTQTPGNEATAQYAATMALTALLVRDALAPADFDTLYAPFRTILPLESLGGLDSARRTGVRA